MAGTVVGRTVVLDVVDVAWAWNGAAVVVEVEVLVVDVDVVVEAAETRTVITKVDGPVAFVAVTVWLVDAEGELAVPEIAPFETSNESPDGRDGLTDQVATAPPLLVGDCVVIAVPTVKVSEADG